ECGAAPLTVTLATSVEHFFVLHTEEVIRVARQNFAFSLARTSITHLPSLPDIASDESYSFGDILSLLSPKGRATFESESRAIDEALRERFKRGKVTPLYFYRRLARMTQEQLAERSGSRQSYISQIEQGKRPLTL